MLVLSLFPGIGLLDKAFEEEGFTIVRGPDPIFGGDVRRFHPPEGRFDGVIGGPPCQTFSSLAHLVRSTGREPSFGNLIPEYERCVAQARPAWFLMENVPAAPEPSVPGYACTSFLLDNSHLEAGDGFGQEQRRLRRFSFGRPGAEPPPSLLRWIDLATFLLPDAKHAVTSVCPNNTQAARTRKTAVTAGHDNPENLNVRKRQRTDAVHADGRATRNRPKFLTGAVTGGDGGASRNVRLQRYTLADALRLQGLPADFLKHCPFTVGGAMKAIANGVPLTMGRAIARAIKEALK